MTPRSPDERFFLRELGDKFRKERDRRAWSIHKAAEQAGVSFHGYARLERGGGSTLAAMYRVARAFGFDPFIILDRSSTAQVGAGRAECDVCARPLLVHRIGECR